MSNELKRAVKQLHVDMTSEDKTIKIKNDAGQDLELDNVIIIGGHSETKALYIFAEGSPDDIAETLAGCFKWSRMGKSNQQVFFKRVFAYFLRRLCELFSIPIESYPRDVQVQSIKNQDEAEALLLRWEEEDRARKKKKEEDERSWN